MRHRDIILGTGATAGAIGPSGFDLTAAPQELVIQPARFALRDQVTTDMVRLSPDAPPPIQYGRQSEELRLPVRNTLPDHTAMHWHRLRRVPNAADGVPS